MNQIDELVARCRPNPVPDPVVTDRHRAELQAIVGTNDQPTDRLRPTAVLERDAIATRTPLPLGRILVGIAAAGLVAASAGVIGMLRSDNDAADSGASSAAIDGKSTPSASNATTDTALITPTTASMTPGASAEGVDTGLLLFPSGPASSVQSAAISPTNPGRWATTLIDSTGEPMRIAMNENFFGDDLPAWERRDIEGLSVWTGNEDGNTVYAVFSPCSIFTVNDGDSTAWDSEVIALLEGVVIDDPSAAVSVPAGWIDLGAGLIESAYELTFTVSIDGRDFQFELTQMPATTIGALATQRSVGFAEPVDISGTDGWMFQTSSSRFIGWQHDDTAVMLTSPGNTPGAQLRMVAASLEPGHSSEWDDLLASPADPGASPTTTALVNTQTNGSCPKPTLTIT